MVWQYLIIILTDNSGLKYYDVFWFEIAVLLQTMLNVCLSRQLTVERGSFVSVL